MHPAPPAAPARRSPGGSSAFNRTDRLILACTALTTIFVVVFAGRLPRWPLLLAGNLALLAALILGLPRLATRPAAPWRWLRSLYPLPWVWAAYAQTGAMNQIVHTGFFDSTLRAWDRWLFGVEPATALAAAFPHPLLAEALHAVYFAYYLLFPALAVLLLLRRGPDVLDDYLSTLCGAFYACGLVFVLFPAAGPVALKPPAAPGSLFPALMDWIYRCFEQPGGAFPSSHVVIALLTLAWAWRHAGRLRPLFAVGCLGVLPATVYCGYHYVVDVLAGIVVALAAVGIARDRGCAPGRLRPGAQS